MGNPSRSQRDLRTDVRLDRRGTISRLKSRHKAVGRFKILYAVSLLAFLPTTGFAQIVCTGNICTTPNLSGDASINNGTNVLIVGTDGTDTSYSGTITNTGTPSIAPHGTVIKTGAGILTVNGATISGGETFLVGGAMGQSGGNTQVDYLSIGTGASQTTGLNLVDASYKGALNVGGGTIDFRTALQVGDFGGAGTVTQTGGNVVVAPGGSNTSNAVSVNIGNQGGTGVYNLSGGSLTFNSGFFVLGRNDSTHPASSGTLNLSGSGALSVANGSLFIGDDVLSATPGTGAIKQTGGTLSIDGASFLFLSGSGNGTYNLSGGTLKIGGSSLVGNYDDRGGTPAFNLGGGTIQVTGSALNADVNANLVGGSTSTIDTNGLGAMWSGVLSGAGALTKAGSGTLTLTGNNTYTGLTTIAAGTLTLSGAGSIAATSGLVNNGTFDISGVTSLIPGLPLAGAALPNLSGAGTVMDGANALVVGTDNSNTRFSGTINNTGTSLSPSFGRFFKTGSGTLTIDGATIQGGEAYVVGGALAQTSGGTYVDYLSIGTGTALTKAINLAGASNIGALNVGGGTIDFRTALQVGDFGGAGTVTQTGGNVVVAPGGSNTSNAVSVNIGNQGGTGIYNLSGGSLTFNSGFFVLGRNDSTHPASSGTLNLSGSGALSVANGSLFIGDDVLQCHARYRRHQTDGGHTLNRRRLVSLSVGQWQRHLQPLRRHAQDRRQFAGRQLRRPGRHLCVQSRRRHDSGDRVGAECRREREPRRGLDIDDRHQRAWRDVVRRGLGRGCLDQSRCWGVDHHIRQHLQRRYCAQCWNAKGRQRQCARRRHAGDGSRHHAGFR